MRKRLIFASFLAITVMANGCKKVEPMPTLNYGNSTEVASDSEVIEDESENIVDYASLNIVEPDENAEEANEEPMYIVEMDMESVKNDAGFTLEAPTFTDMEDEIYMVVPNKMIIRRSLGTGIDNGEIQLKKMVSDYTEEDDILSRSVEDVKTSASGIEVKCSSDVDDGTYDTFEWSLEGYKYKLEIIGADLSADDILVYIDEIK